MEHTTADTYKLSNPDCAVFTNWSDWASGKPSYSLRFRESETGYELTVAGITAQTLAKLCQEEPILEALSREDKKAAQVVQCKPTQTMQCLVFIRCKRIEESKEVGQTLADPSAKKKPFNFANGHQLLVLTSIIE